MKLNEKLQAAVSGGIDLCVGLDPVLDRIPEKLHGSAEPLYEFNKAIIEATVDYAAAYKPNMAFYEAYGAPGWTQLEKTIRIVPEGKIVIADAKRGDIGNTAKSYAKALFSGLNADMATVNPYLGRDSLMPFIDDPKHGVFVLAVTSNPGGADLQELVIDGKPLYLHVVRLAQSLNKHGNVGLVVGATKPSLWRDLLETAVDMPLLVPGIGAQGGDIEALRAVVRNYPAPVLVNASRSILYASSGDDFQDAAREAAKKLAGELN